jgi:UDP-N-acetyl-D-glucosamine/UDP-N-acetyl-D-galactosamine dehydrogenase
MREQTISVVGLGYVGLPVALAFSGGGYEVIGFDIDARRVAELISGVDRTLEATREELAAARVEYTSDPQVLRKANFHIVTVPTPLDDANRPDLRALLSASETIGAALKRGDIVVYESTVYPGLTEEACVPVLERRSGLHFGTDFSVGYSPERINPGDKQHRFTMIKKIVAGSDERTARIVADVYGSVVTAGIHIAASIKVAEAAKVIENAQRDINIAFVNELSAIFSRMDIDTSDVLDAAATKWNFLNFRPGLVGGHCIGIDPFYLTYQAERFGYYPEIVLAGRRLNDGMGARIARECVKQLLARHTATKSLRVTILGCTFKENVPDIRNSKVFDIVRELNAFGIETQILDPLADEEAVRHEYGFSLTREAAAKPADAVVLAVRHDVYLAAGWAAVTRLLAGNEGVVLDIKGTLDRALVPKGVSLWRL